MTKAKKRSIILVVAALLLVAAVSAGATLAYLLDTTAPVTNTFTVGKIEIELIESGVDNTTGVKAYENVLPGNQYAKDPTVIVKKDSEASYLFVKIDEENNALSATNTGKVIEWDIADGWDELTGTNNVYYCKVPKASTDNLTYRVLKGDPNIAALVNGCVTVNENATPENFANQPTITFTAYAVQQANLTVAEAWAEAQSAETTAP